MKKNNNNNTNSISYGYHQFDWNDILLTQHISHNNNDEKNDEEKQSSKQHQHPKLLKFADIKRIAGNDLCALEGNGGIILRDGKYPVYKFIHDINPVYKVIPITWIPKDNTIKNSVGYVQINDDNWYGQVPIMHATRSNVTFYGCHLDPKSTDINTPYIQCKNGGMFIGSNISEYSK